VNKSRIAEGLGVFSVTLGLVEALAPRGLGKAVGLRQKDGLLRGFGLREVASGVALLAARKKSPWMWGRVVGDVLDIATLATGVGAKNPNRKRTMLALGAVAGIAALDYFVARDLQEHRA
jgi:hypothetical protein